MAKAKSTKKFEKRHLKDTLERRKGAAKIKKRHDVRAKQTAKRSLDQGAADDDDDNGEKKVEKNGKAFENMTVDDFFAGGFDIPERSKQKRKRTTNGAHNAALKKAKLSKDEKENGDDAELASDGGDSDSVDEIDDAGGVLEAEDDGVSDESDDEEGHKKQLESLKKSDPEFYKHLEEDDPELLDFEVGDFEEIDELSDDDSPDKKSKASKNKKGGKLELDMVERWETSMSTTYSLRATREVVLAFRAATHINDTSEPKSYKYTITNPEGITTSNFEHI
jgi:nucleolar complex protein 2